MPKYPQQPAPEPFSSRLPGVSAIPQTGGMYADTTKPQQRSMQAFSALMGATGKYFDKRNKEQIEKDLNYLQGEQRKINGSLIQYQQEHPDLLPLTPQQRHLAHRLDGYADKSSRERQAYEALTNIDDPTSFGGQFLQYRNDPEGGQKVWDHFFGKDTFSNFPADGEGGYAYGIGFDKDLVDSRERFILSANKVFGANKLEDTRNAFVNSVNGAVNDYMMNLESIQETTFWETLYPEQREERIDEIKAFYGDQLQALIDDNQGLMTPELRQTVYDVIHAPSASSDLSDSVHPDDITSLFQQLRSGPADVENRPYVSETIAGKNTIARAAAGTKRNLDKKLEQEHFTRRREFWQIITDLSDPTDPTVVDYEINRLYELIDAGIFGEDELFDMFKTADTAVIRGEKRLMNFLNEQGENAIIAQANDGIQGALANNFKNGSPGGSSENLAADLKEATETATDPVTGTSVGVQMPDGTIAEQMKILRTNQRQVLEAMLIKSSGGKPDLSLISEDYLDLFVDEDGNAKEISYDNVAQYLSLLLDDPDNNKQVLLLMQNALESAHKAYVTEGDKFEDWFWGTPNGNLMQALSKVAGDPRMTDILWNIADPNSEVLQFFSLHNKETTGHTGMLPPSVQLMETFRKLASGRAARDKTDLIPKGFTDTMNTVGGKMGEWMQFREKVMDQIGDNMGGARGPLKDESQGSGVFPYGSGSLFYLNATGDLDFDNLPLPQRNLLNAWLHRTIDGINPHTDSGMTQDDLMDGILRRFRQDFERTGKRAEPRTTGPGSITMISGENVRYSGGGIGFGTTFGGVFQFGNQGKDHKGVPIRILSTSDDVFTQNIASKDNNTQRRFAEFAPRLFSGYDGAHQEEITNRYQQNLEKSAEAYGYEDYPTLMKAAQSGEEGSEIHTTHNKVIDEARRALEEEVPDIYNRIRFEPTDISQTRRLFRGRQYPDEVHSLVEASVQAEWPVLPPHLWGPDGINWDKVSILGDDKGVYHLVDESVMGSTGSYGRVIPGFQFTAEDINNGFEWWLGVDQENRRLWDREDLFRDEHHGYGQSSYKARFVDPIRENDQYDKTHGIKREGHLDARDDWVGPQPYNWEPNVNNPEEEFWGEREINGVSYVLPRPLSGHIQMPTGTDGYMHVEHVDDFMHMDGAAPRILGELATAGNSSFYGEGAYRFFHNGATGRMTFIREPSSQDSPKIARTLNKKIQSLEGRSNVRSLSADEVNAFYANVLNIDASSNHITKTFNDPDMDALREEHIQQRRAEEPDRVVYRNQTKGWLQRITSVMHPHNSQMAQQEYRRLEPYIESMEFMLYETNGGSFPLADQVDGLNSYEHVYNALQALRAWD